MRQQKLMLVKKTTHEHVEIVVKFEIIIKTCDAWNYGIKNYHWATSVVLMELFSISWWLLKMMQSLGYFDG
jgi:hypothetical protein